MANGADFTERQADRYWALDNFDVEYVEWCEENDTEPSHEHFDEWLRDRAEDRDYDAYRDER